MSFRLEPVLKTRLATRRQRQADLAAAQQAIDEVDRELEQLEGEIDHLREFARQQLSATPLDMPAVLDCRRFEAALLRELATARHYRDELSQDLERRRAALRAADGEARAIEKVSDKRLADVQQAFEKHRQEEADDLARRAVAPAAK
jgi:flagellar export protein FliJ